MFLRISVGINNLIVLCNYFTGVPRRIFLENYAENIAVMHNEEYSFFLSVCANTVLNNNTLA